ncbi:hypothetical protein [Candidatus Magnetobacterium casense]|uniref:Uncharacterized protein n=1 Tax=Candidatus Magnetobacterium casense TaxID=1455061 RepID=A0ABS6RXU4_9BACT|nr:hypothetical protein [Candidatus Magnetobacterium casensis]MBV6341462.1 hypothetical protein [Candidatus Magnetobacterium casensis]
MFKIAAIFETPPETYPTFTRIAIRYGGIEQMFPPTFVYVASCVRSVLLKTLHRLSLPVNKEKLNPHQGRNCGVSDLVARLTISRIFKGRLLGQLSMRFKVRTNLSSTSV